MSNQTPLLTIVTPSYEGHARQYEQMIKSISEYCADIDYIRFVLIIEKCNFTLFDDIISKYTKNYCIVLTEDVLSSFGVQESPNLFLRRVNKFTFQTIKKFGGILAVTTEWFLVLDSECIFLKPFSARKILNDYASQKYVFYTLTEPRGEIWFKSTGHAVNTNTGAVLAMNSTDRWYMEYFHWFYERDKFCDLISNHLGSDFWDVVQGKKSGQFDFFENILYYNFIEKYHSENYNFIDFREALIEDVDDHISGRFNLSELPFALFGNEYLLNIVVPDEIHLLARFFDRYKLPFVRLEPPTISPRYFEELCKLPSFIATISSHHHVWLHKKIAICVSGEFRHQIHRVPEQQVRSIKSFLSGVDCDIYLHSWRSTSEALILEELKPKRYLFEAPIDFSEMAKNIKCKEPKLKRNRDKGSLAMFYAMEKCFDLIGDNIDDYDFIVRIRPDLSFNRSLKEILINLSDNGDVVDDTLYLPKHFHSKGMNDQFAIGSTSVMSIYFRTNNYVKQNIADVFFNPEYLLLENIIKEQIRIRVADVPYSLMRGESFRIENINRLLGEQEHSWWSRTSQIAEHVDVTQYFREKAKSMNFMMRKSTKEKMLIPVKANIGKTTNLGGLIEVRNVDNNPSWHTALYYKSAFVWNVYHFILENTNVKTADYQPKDVFVFDDGDDIVYSEWALVHGKMKNGIFKVKVAELDPKSSLSDAERNRAWARYNRLYYLAGIKIFRCWKSFLAGLFRRSA